MDHQTRWLGIAAVSVVGICVLACAAIGLTIRFAPTFCPNYDGSP